MKSHAIEQGRCGRCDRASMLSLPGRAEGKEGMTPMLLPLSPLYSTFLDFLPFSPPSFPPSLPHPLSGHTSGYAPSGTHGHAYSYQQQQPGSVCLAGRGGGREGKREENIRDLESGKKGVERRPGADLIAERTWSCRLLQASRCCRPPCSRSPPCLPSFPPSLPPSLPPSPTPPVTRSIRDPQAPIRPDMGRGTQATCRRT